MVCGGEWLSWRHAGAVRASVNASNGAAGCCLPAEVRIVCRSCILPAVSGPVTGSMQHPALILLFCLIAISGHAREMPSVCARACAELAERIRREPTRLAMAIEDALVAHEPCTSALITTALDTVAAEPLFVREIWETAVKVLPNRRAEIEQAVRRFSVPRAIAVKEPKIVIRRAEPANREPELEVRRAESADSNNTGVLPEIRRAEVPVTAKPATKALR